MSDKKSNAAEKKKAVIYLGPSIPGVVAAGTVFNNGLTVQLEAVAAEIPAVKMLLVETAKAVKTKKELKAAGSASAICYEAVEKYVKGRGKKG